MDKREEGGYDWIWRTNWFTSESETMIKNENPMIYERDIWFLASAGVQFALLKMRKSNKQQKIDIIMLQ